MHLLRFPLNSKLIFVVEDPDELELLVEQAKSGGAGQGGAAAPTAAMAPPVAQAVTMPADDVNMEKILKLKKLRDAVRRKQNP